MMPMIQPFEYILLTFLVIAAVAVCVTSHLLASVILFASFSAVMSILWILLGSPDLALTEAAVGAGISSLLYFVVLKRIRVMEEEGRLEAERRAAEKEQEGSR